MVALAVIAIFNKWFGTSAALGIAAWVQAIGAVGVIIATAWIATLNFSDERDHSRRAEQQLKETVAILAEHCLDRLDYITDNVRDGTNNRNDFAIHYIPSDFDAPMEGLAAIELHHLGDTRLITAVIDLRREMGRIKSQLDSFSACLSDNRAAGLLFNVQDLRNRRTLVFNAMASVMRLVSPDGSAEDRISYLNSRVRGPS